MPDLIRHPAPFWIPAFAGMTTVGHLTAGVITLKNDLESGKQTHEPLNPGPF